MFQVETVGGKTKFFYVLVEHKSYRDRHVAVQLLEYIALIYRRWVIQYGRSGQPVPELSVLVMYHGAEPWDVPTRFSALYENPAEVSPLSLDFGYVLLDLSNVTCVSMPGHTELRAGLMALKYSMRRRLTVEEAMLLAKALKMCDPSFRKVTLDYLDRAFKPAPHKVFSRTASKIIKEDVEMFRSAADKYTTLGHREGRREGLAEGLAQGKAEGKAEGMAKGEAKGKAEGKAEGKADLLTLLLSDRFGKVSLAVRKRIGMDQGTNLDTWFRRALRAQTIDEVFAD